MVTKAIPQISPQDYFLNRKHVQRTLKRNKNVARCQVAFPV